MKFHKFPKIYSIKPQKMGAIAHPLPLPSAPPPALLQCMASTAKKAASSADNDQRQKSLEEPPKTAALDEMTKAKNSSSLHEEKDIADSTILEQFAADDKTNFAEESTKLPKWLYKYLLFRFNLLDRTGESMRHWASPPTPSNYFTK